MRFTFRIPTINLKYQIDTFLNHFWEPFVIHAFRENGLRQKHFFPFIKPGDVFIDVGTAYGSYTIPAAMLGAQVFSFEPRPEIISILLHNLELNGLVGRVMILQNVAGAEPHRILSFCESGLFSSIITDDEHRRHGCKWTYKVHSTSIDTVVERMKLNQVNWIKVDAEGAEYDVIVGAAKTIKKFRPNMIIENHQKSDANIKNEIHDFIYKDLGITEYQEITRVFDPLAKSRPHSVYSVHPEVISGGA